MKPAPETPLDAVLLAVFTAFAAGLVIFTGMG